MGLCACITIFEIVGPFFVSTVWGQPCDKNVLGVGACI